MEKKGLKILRFNNLQVLQSINDVLDVIFDTLDSRLSKREV
jgi:very-short-patch-repair endonuclease